LREILKQPEFHPRSLEEEVVSLMIVESGVLDPIEPSEVRNKCEEIMKTIRQQIPDVLDHIRTTGRLSDTDRNRLTSLIERS
jgi:F-type H+-transporting ATPase subunit alpha